MPTHSVAILPGDGIGPEVIQEAVRILDAALFASGEAVVRWESYPWGTDFFLNHGRMMPKDGLRILRQHEAILLGAVGSPRVRDHVTLQGLLLPIRREFDLYINLRPSILYEGVPSPLRDKAPGSIDLVVLRENTEGEYADVGGRVHRRSEQEVAIQTSVFTRYGTERIIRAAFEMAKGRRRHVTSITKSNAQGHSMVFWDEVFDEVATDYPEIRTHRLLVDAAALDLVRRPESFDVVVASNLFGDILTDLAAGIVGGIGLAASANLNPSRSAPSMFEPVHGSAPDIAGKGIANPIGAVLAGVLLLDHLGLRRTAELVHQAVKTVMRRRKTLTPDLGGSAKTTEVGEAILQALSTR